jgi:hypothetical protein
MICNCSMDVKFQNCKNQLYYLQSQQPIEKNVGEFDFLLKEGVEQFCFYKKQKLDWKPSIGMASNGFNS